MVRTLDDMPRHLLMTCLATKGEKLLDTLEQAVLATHVMINDMEAEAHMTNTNMLANDAITRKGLRARLWGVNKDRATVKHDVRDLGAHLNTIRETRNKTMAKICKPPTEVANIMNHMPAPR